MRKIIAILATFVAVSAFSGCGIIGREPTNSTVGEDDNNKIYTIDEFCKRFDDEKNFASKHSKDKFTISGTIEKSSDIFLKDVHFNSSFESERWHTNYRITCEFEDRDTIKDLGEGDTVTIRGKLFSVATSGIILQECELVSLENNNESSGSIESNSDTSQAEIPEPREAAIGKSDKDVDKLTPNPSKPKPVNNDKTGNLRYAGFGNKNVDFSKYALSYYNKRFESNKEIHAVMNFTDETTTRIICSENMGVLFVTVFKYVKGEDNNVDLMFTGDIVKDYVVYTDNGDIEDITEPKDKTASTTSTITSSSSSISSSSFNSSTSSTKSTTQSTPEPPKSSSTVKPSNPKPQTTEYVLNTSTLKVHKPTCRDVDRIDKENYATTTNLQNVINNGYTACGHCNPF